MLKAILTQTDVLTFTGLPDDFPKCDMRSIFQTEYNEFINCLGIDFRKYLVSELADYSEAKKYDNKETYVSGDVVFYKGVYKRVTLDDDSNEQKTTGNIPDDICFWENAPRFKKDCLNDAWCTFIGPYLSWVVVRANAPFFFTKLTAKGFVKNEGKGFKSGDMKSYQVYSAAIKREITTAFTNMHHFMEHNNETGCYDLYKGLAEDCCGDCGYAICKCPPCSCGKSDCDSCGATEGDYEYEIA